MDGPTFFELRTGHFGGGNKPFYPLKLISVSELLWKVLLQKRRCSGKLGGISRRAEEFPA
jgi:hypothetical protein